MVSNSIVLERRNDVKRINNGKGKRLPEVAGSWPIIGHLHLLAGSQVAHKVLGSMADKFGPIFTIKLGVHRVLVVCSSEMAKECLTTNDRAFASRPKAMATELMGYNYASVGLAPHGPYWRMIRKLIVLELTSQHRLQMLARIKVSEVKSSMMDIYRTWVTNARSYERVIVDMKQWFGKLVVNIVVKMMFGNHFSPGEQNGDQFLKAITRFAQLVGEFVPSDFIPWIRWLDLGGYEMKMKKTALEMDAAINGWLEDHKKKRNYASTLQVDESKDQDIFMAALLRRVEEAAKEELYGFNADDVVKSTCLIHHDPQIWITPFEFHPDRFLTSNKEVDVKGRHFELIPFGSGRRMCLGMSFALESLQLILASIIHAFEFQNPSNEKINMTESFGLVNHKAGPFELQVAPRLSPRVYGFLD
ncbi:hypothetical protein E3N88_25630 [Mikania micrantha]|uniref:Cytochrome P450 n=1 Tax=Mikania micrantha TaxID=192012 RepID=A0A5N6N675_9ASTR|nr:hypothetical protein E3N88_25630 [Mikania micrantha]